MTSPSLLQAWIVEALDVPARRASPLAVAKTVWIRHESDLKSAGDLLFTWQFDLRSTAEAMVAAGTLTVEESGEWTLCAGATVPPAARRGWSEADVTTAVEGYVTIWLSEQAGAPLRRNQIMADIGARTGRSGAQLDAMMANISQVIQEHGLVPLAIFPPRSNVPAGVRPVVAAALVRAAAQTGESQ